MNQVTHETAAPVGDGHLVLIFLPQFPRPSDENWDTCNFKITAVSYLPIVLNKLIVVLDNVTLHSLFLENRPQGNDR